jgi:hypothetical protein
VKGACYCTNSQKGWLIKVCLTETYSKVDIGKHFPDSFPLQNGLKQGNDLSPLFFNFSLEYAVKKVQKNKVGLKLSGAHQLLTYDGVNILGGNVHAMKKNTEPINDASKEVGVQITVEKTKCVLVFLTRMQVKIGT